MKQKGFAPILVVLIFSAIFIFAGTGYWYSASNKKVVQERPKQDASIQNIGEVKSVQEEPKQNAGIQNGGGVKVATMNALYPDLSTGEKLVGAAHNIFVGKVMRMSGTISGNGKVPYTKFEVKPLFNIKGNIGGLVTVKQLGIASGNGIVVMEDSAPLMTIGYTYVLATRCDLKNNSCTLISHPSGWKIISTDETLSDPELINLAKKDPRVNELRIAYPNEILDSADVYHKNTPNSFESLSQEKQDQLRAEAEQLKAQMQK